MGRRCYRERTRERGKRHRALAFLSSCCLQRWTSRSAQEPSRAHGCKRPWAATAMTPGGSLSPAWPGLASVRSSLTPPWRQPTAPRRARSVLERLTPYLEVFPVSSSASLPSYQCSFPVCPRRTCSVSNRRSRKTSRRSQRTGRPRRWQPPWGEREVTLFHRRGANEAPLGWQESDPSPTTGRSSGDI